MKIKFAIDFTLSRKSLNSPEQHILFQSFYKYCCGTFFSYQSIPRIGEFVNLDDIMREWSQEYKEAAGEEFNTLWQLIITEVRVCGVTHTLDHAIISCTDVFQSE